MRVHDIMSKEVVTLQVDEELSVASDIMHLARIRHLPVLEGDSLVGIISQRDLYKASLASVMGYDYAETREYLKTVVIREVMVKEVVTINGDVEIHEAGRIMLDRKIGCLPVVQGDRLVGMVTETDVLEYYVNHHQHCPEDKTGSRRARGSRH